MPGPAWLLLPTYNERENLDPLVRAVLPVLAEASPAGHRVLIIDDSSPDGTGDLADALAEELDGVSVLHRPVREGLGPAYIAGFHRALEQGAGRVLEMDADFSHDPADVRRLLAAADEGADLVLGSRYVPGGAVTDWGPIRRGLSRGGSWYARRILGLDVMDMTGGFKCFDRRVLESLDLDSVRSYGYAFQIELTYRAARRGFVVREVPIRFRNRRLGSSKMSGRIALEAVWRVPQMRFRTRS